MCESPVIRWLACFLNDACLRIGTVSTVHASRGLIRQPDARDAHDVWGTGAVRHAICQLCSAKLKLCRRMRLISITSVGRGSSCSSMKLHIASSNCIRLTTRRTHRSRSCFGIDSAIEPHPPHTRYLQAAGFSSCQRVESFG